MHVAGGCFWGTEYHMQGAKGVVGTRIGYMGGTVPYPDEAQISTGTTAHRETVEVLYDPSRTSFEALVRHFFNGHDPTRNLFRRGGLYNSTVFYLDSRERRAALEIIEELMQRGLSIVTEVRPRHPFYPAPPTFQGYYRRKGRKPARRNCQVLFPVSSK